MTGSIDLHSPTIFMAVEKYLRKKGNTKEER